MQEIAVISANTGTTMQTLTESEELSDFISALDMEHWELETLPKESKWIGTFRFSQEKTIKFGENPTDGELYPVCEILCYEGVPYLTLKAAGLEMTFKVTDTAMEHLTNYFQA